MKVAIVGCGLIGQKRAKTLAPGQLVAAVDKDYARAEALAANYSGCNAYNDVDAMLAKETVDVVIVATLHASLVDVGLVAVKQGKHVLLEKPGARNPQELEGLIAAAKQTNALVRVGFNHRYHRAFLKAKALIAAGELGDLLFVRARYGHGGRVGYDKEWRADPKLSGGGELIDQGVHLIDLARWFLGDFVDIQGYAHTYYWDMPVDDNSFLLLKTKTNQVAFLQASCTEWKNTFSFEIYGRKGKLDINGLGGSYGVERLSFYKMLKEMGPPETTIWEYPMADNSWQTEIDEFFTDIQVKRQPNPNIYDAHATLKIVEEIYRMSNR